MLLAPPCALLQLPPQEGEGRSRRHPGPDSPGATPSRHFVLQERRAIPWPCTAAPRPSAPRREHGRRRRGAAHSQGGHPSGQKGPGVKSQIPRAAGTLGDKVFRSPGTDGKGR